MSKCYWERMLCESLLALALLIGGLTLSSATAAPVIMTDAQSPTIIRRVDTIAALRVLVGSPSIKAVQVMGHKVAGDGGGGDYYWSSGKAAGYYLIGGAAPDNGGTIITPTGGNGSAAWVASDVVVATQTIRIPTDYLLSARTSLTIFRATTSLTLN